MMGMENNVYGELLLGLQLENQKILLTSLQEDGTLEKHIYERKRGRSCRGIGTAGSV